MEIDCYGRLAVDGESGGALTPLIQRSGNARYFQQERGVEFAGTALNLVRSTGDQWAERRL